jgi:AmmeMemoRadiSam system protein A
MKDLAPEEKAELLRLAREGVASDLLGRAEPEPRLLSDAMRRPCGAFVTLRQLGELRGCIGSLRATEPLHRTVVNMARAAAFEDPRFPALSRSELDSTRFEISRLGPLTRVSAAEVVPGRHGLYIVRDAHRGVLLPQVAVEHGWDRDRFLAETCHKAGLAGNAWRDPHTEIYVFEAECFAESD